MTETAKWRDPWFRKLSPTAKLLWCYLCDNCNPAGIIELDVEGASFDIGSKVTQAHIEEISSRISVRNEKMLLKKFITFQCGKLSPACPAHKPVIAAVEKYGLVETGDGHEYPNATLALPYAYPSARVSEQPETKDKNEDPLPIPKKLQTPAFVSAWGKWMNVRRGMKKPKNWAEMFREQLEWLDQYDPATAIEILGYSTRNNYQGLQPPKPGHGKPANHTDRNENTLNKHVANQYSKAGKAYATDANGEPI